jgi:hypothetical protein
MRFLCFIQGHRWATLREQWLPPKGEDDFQSLLRFDECSHCHDVRAMIIHPLDYKSRFSLPTRAFHRAECPEPHEA